MNGTGSLLHLSRYGFRILFLKGFSMIRWVAVIFFGLTIFYMLIPELAHLGVGRLPGDVRFRLGSLACCLPFGSTILWSAMAFAVAEVVSRVCLSC